MTRPNPYAANIKQPVLPGSHSTGASVLGVKVMSVSPGSRPPVAVVQDPSGRQIQVRIDIQRGRGSIPRAGEKWIIDQAMGVWTFVCMTGATPDGAGSSGDLNSVTGLPDALAAHDDALATHDARLDGMWQQATVVAASATTADIQLPDGTVQAGCQPVSSYQPTVGDTVWTSTVDAAGSRVVLGSAASTTSAQTVGQLTAADLTITDYGITTPRVSDWWLKLIAGNNFPPIPGFPVAGISLFHTDATNNQLQGVRLDFVQGGSGANPSMLVKNDLHKSGILWGDGCLYFTDNTGANRIALYPSQVITSLGGGMVMGQDPNANPALFFTAKNLGLVGGNDGSIHVTDGVNSRYADLRAQGIAAAGGLSALGGLAITGQTTLTGGLVGTFGASLRGSTLQADSILCAPAGYVPTAFQMYAQDVTGTNNIAVGNVFFYKGVAQNMNPASERSLKTNIEPLGDPWEFINSLAPSRFDWIDTEHHDDRRHVGIMVDEMATADPDTVYTPEFAIEDGIWEQHPERAVRWHMNHGRHPEERALLAYAMRALQDAHERIGALEAVLFRDSAPKE